jgi:hypothetical protein
MEAGLNLEIESNKYEILNSVIPSNNVNRVIKELYILSKLEIIWQENYIKK